MAVFGNSETILKSPEVTFSIEMRPSTTTQLGAGKRLFSRLLLRTQSFQKTCNESKQINKRI